MATLAAAVALTLAAPLASTVAVRSRCTGTLVIRGFGVATCGARSLLVRRDHVWREITPPRLTQPIHDVVFLDERHGWVATNDCVAGRAFVYRTADGGRAWASARVSSTNCSAGSRLELFFLDETHGWLVRIWENGPGAELERTTDGGTTWLPIPDGLPLLGGVVFRSSREGWLGGGNFAVAQGLYRTRDGGRTWRRRVLPPPVGWSGARIFPALPALRGARGVLPATLVRAGRTAVAFYVTDDGGRTWRVRSVRPVVFEAVETRSPFVRHVPTSIAGPSVWWVVGGRSARSVYVTEDAGRHWHVGRAPAATIGGYVSISAVDARHAWISGSRLVATTDGGRTWVPIAPG